jgi:hypothetical protein
MMVVVCVVSSHILHSQNYSSSEKFKCRGTFFSGCFLTAFKINFQQVLRVVFGFGVFARCAR